MTVKDTALLGLALPAALLAAFLLVWWIRTPKRASVVIKSRQEVVHTDRLLVGDVLDETKRGELP